MKIKLIGHTQLSKNIFNEFGDTFEQGTTDAQVISLMAVRSCYSHKTACEVLETEGKKYLGNGAKESKRLMDHIVKSKHLSTTEHVNFVFAVEGVSRALLAQLTRHRQLSFSVQSQRYNKFSSDSRSGGFDYVVPETVTEEKTKDGTFLLIAEEMKPMNAKLVFDEFMEFTQKTYDNLIKCGVPQEDARAVLPNAAACNLVTSGNLRAWLEFYKKRKKGEGAQAEVAELAELIRNEIQIVEPWTSDYFDM